MLKTLATWWGRTTLAALAGLASALSFEPYHWVWLLPPAVAVVTLCCHGVRPRTGFWLGATFGAVFMLVLLPWLTVIAVYAWVPLAAFEGLFYGLAGLSVAVLTRRSAVPLWPVWAAAAWVLLEALRSLVPFGGFPWGRLAFAVEDTPLMPAFAYLGGPGVSFLVALLGTTLAWAVLRVRHRPVRAAIGVLGAVALACVSSVLPWRATAPGDRQVEVALVQGNVPGTGLEAFDERRAVLDNHVAATLDLASRVAAGTAPQPDLVIWPENSSDIDPYVDPAARAAIGGAARAVGAPLLMGAVVGQREVTGWHNRAIGWSADGRPGAWYDKRHPVPFGEYIPLRSLLAPRISALDQIPNDMVTGTRPGVLTLGPARAGVLMCFEVAYDGLVRSVVDAGADVVVVPTNNATYTGTGQIEQQFAMSRLRAVETGRTVLVASTNGISGVVAPDGSVVRRAPQQERAVLEARVTLSHGTTPAVALGAWPEIVLSAVAVAATLLGALLGRRRPRARRDRDRVATATAGQGGRQ